MKEIAAIVAMDSHHLIGAHGGLPWHVPADLKRFSNLTTGHTVMMGSSTWRSLPDRYRPLPRRTNVVISRDATLLAPGGLPAGVVSSTDPIQFAKRWLTEPSNQSTSFQPNLSQPATEQEVNEEILWVIGGAKLYATMLPLCSRLELTIVDGAFQGDTYIEPFEEQFEILEEEVSDGCRFLSLKRRVP